MRGIESSLSSMNAKRETRLASGLRAVESKGFSIVPKRGIDLILDSFATVGKAPDGGSVARCQPVSGPVRSRHFRSALDHVVSSHAPLPTRGAHRRDRRVYAPRPPQVQGGKEEQLCLPSSNEDVTAVDREPWGDLPCTPLACESTLSLPYAAFLGWMVAIKTTTFKKYL